MKRKTVIEQWDKYIMKNTGLMLIELKANMITIFTNNSQVVSILLKFHIDHNSIF